MTALSAYSNSTEYLPSAAVVPVHCAGACCLQVETLLGESSMADGAHVIATLATVTGTVTSRLPTIETVTFAVSVLCAAMTGSRAVIRARVLCAGALRPLSGRVGSLQGMRLGRGQEHDRGLPAGCLHGAFSVLCAVRVKRALRVLHAFSGKCTLRAQRVFRGFHTLRALRAKHAFRAFRALHGLRAKHGINTSHPALSRRSALSALPLLPDLSYLPVMPASVFKPGRPAIKRF